MRVLNVPSTFAGNKVIKMIRVYFVSFQMLHDFYIIIESKFNNNQFKFNNNQFKFNNNQFKFNNNFKIHAKFKRTQRESFLVRGLSTLKMLVSL
jgi:hypothetical protein